MITTNQNQTAFTLTLTANGKRYNLKGNCRNISINCERIEVPSVTMFREFIPGPTIVSFEVDPPAKGPTIVSFEVDPPAKPRRRVKAIVK